MEKNVALPTDVLMLHPMLCDQQQRVEFLKAILRPILKCGPDPRAGRSK